MQKGCLMSVVKSGDEVRVHYTGTLTDGTEFDTSKDKDALSFIVGKGQVIPGFEDAVEGMTIGEKKEVLIPVDKAYGPHSPLMVMKVDRADLPADMEFQVGMQLELGQAEGGSSIVAVTEVTEEQVVMDANHPLAGQDLNFEIELVEIAAT